MKSYAIVPLLVAAAVAQTDDTPNCGIENIPVSDLMPQVQVIGQALVDINGTTTDLKDAVTTFVGSDINSLVALNTASQNVLSQLSSSNDAVAATPALSDSDDDQIAAFDLTRFVGSLSCNVQRTVAVLISRKQDLIDACIGPLVLQSAQQQETASNTFSDTANSKLPPSLKAESDRAVQPIKDALASAVSAFAAETTTPASCGATSTTTSTSTTSATSTSVTVPPGGGSVYPTGGNPYPTANPYPTSSEEDCEDEPTGSYAPGNTVYPTGEYPTGGKPHPTTTTVYGTWEPVPYPSESATSYFPSKPSPSGKPSTYEPHPEPSTYEPHPKPSSYAPEPVASIPESIPASYATSAPVYTSTKAPVYTTTKVPSATYSAPVYTGAAVANAANGFGAVAFVAAVVAAL